MSKEIKTIRITKKYEPPEFKQAKRTNTRYYNEIRCYWCRNGKCSHHQIDGVHQKFGMAGFVSYRVKQRKAKK